jgi:hypothetical protein
MNLAAQADDPGRTGHLNQKTFDPGHPAETPKSRNAVYILEQSVHSWPFRGPSAPESAHLAGKDLNGGKLNKANQGDATPRVERFFKSGFAGPELAFINATGC